MKSELLDLPPPNAVESERALLAGFLERGRVDPDCDLQAIQFYDGRNGAIYSAMSDLEAELGAWDTIALVEKLRHNPTWGKNGFDSAYVAETLTTAGNPAIGAYHSRQIKQAWRRRTVAQEAEQLLRLSHDGFDANALQDVLGRIGAAVSDNTDSIEAPGFTRLLTGADLLALDLKPRFLVRGVLVEGQPAIIGGRSKTLKTGVACDLAISLGSGTQFLGRFDSQQVPVGFWSGESGAATIRETAKRQAAAKGVDLADCSVLWSFELPKLSQRDHLDHLRATIERHGLRVVIVDPLYLALLSAETAGAASNLFAMGAALHPLFASYFDSDFRRRCLHSDVRWFIERILSTL